MSDNKIHIFGIRHHGPGSARSLNRALAELAPDCVLIEGPPDADALLPLFADPEMKPPVAILIYDPKEPQRAVFDPLVDYSPELQAIRYALTHNVTVRFMDLPQSLRLATVPVEEAAAETTVETTTPEAELAPESAAEEAAGAGENIAAQIAADPLRWVAEAAGFSDGERWWEQLVETRRDSAEVFTAIMELMAALREDISDPEPMEQQREAHMRATMRAALAEGHERIAVICGAWHAPALRDLADEKADADTLRGLKKIKVEATVVPWTYGRLASASGYGAGVRSPGWYGHLWESPDEATVLWLARVARLLREEDLDASAAQVIDAVRLAETLASLRGSPLPGLPELNEASLAVFCNGDDTPLQLISQRLIIGDALGSLPERTPAVPLVADLAKQQKRLRLKAEATVSSIDLDLRKENELERSHLLHRLALLDVDWGHLKQVGGGKKGTFHELWDIQWRPELSVSLVVASRWGVTIDDAATNYIRETTRELDDLPALTGFVERALLADLPGAVETLMARLGAVAAVASDMGHLMEALPPLANVMRYGNVRQTDASAVGQVVDGLVARIAIGLPGALASLDDDAAAAMFGRVMAVNEAIALLQNEDYRSQWQATLKQLATQAGLHGLIAGRVTRLLLDSGVFHASEAARRLSLALSRAVKPAQSAAWIEGFLRGGGLVLLHDTAVWGALDEWIASLADDLFTTTLPLLRRTFSTFTAPERRQMGERARAGKSQRHDGQSATPFDRERAEAVLPLLTQLLGASK